jgi:hypothetical protein
VTSGDADGFDPAAGDTEVSRADPGGAAQLGTVARASFRDAAGKESTADLALVRAEHLASGRPWRVFRWRQGQAHCSGWYWSATTGGHVVYESRLELARLLLADFDPRVTSIAAQPFLVTAPSGGRVRRHVPDFLLACRDGGVCVVNVKPADQLAVPRVADALAWAGRFSPPAAGGTRSGRGLIRCCWRTCGSWPGTGIPAGWTRAWWPR